MFSYKLQSQLKRVELGNRGLYLNGIIILLYSTNCRLYHQPCSLTPYEPAVSKQRAPALALERHERLPMKSDGLVGLLGCKLTGAQ